jgi:rfaE bifunctional protein kinase chain/domain
MTTAGILAAFRELRVLVVGDVCLDRWCRYDPSLSEPSRETGIPRIAVTAAEVTPGAAGTVANNLAALGAGRVDILGIIGNDGFGYELEHALEARSISTSLLLRSDVLPTFTYTKLLNGTTGEEDLPRVDFVNPRPIPEEFDRELAACLERIAANYDVILVSDQAETAQGGVVTPAVRQALSCASSALVWVDSRMRAEHFRGVIVKPNRQEADAASLRALGRVDYRAFRSYIKAPLLIVTQGPEGALVVSEQNSEWVRTRPVKNPIDICGAGDSFSAGAALALRVTGDPAAAVQFGNLVASITIMKKGTGTASPAELLAVSSGT